MNVTRPVFIAVAPNGARHSKDDHPNVPITPRELADTALACAEAGASMIHLHVRDSSGRHSLEPAHYRPAIREIKSAVGDEMLVQVTSEAAGIYTAEQQMRLIEELAPDGVSLAIRELLSSDTDMIEFARFLTTLEARGSLIQYILYDPDDVRRYRQLCVSGVIPSGNHLVLFVLGRYTKIDLKPENLDHYVAELDSSSPWMACAFGDNAFDVLAGVANRGGYIRIGFENGWVLPDGNIAADNASLVRAMATRIRESGHKVATATEAAALWE